MNTRKTILIILALMLAACLSTAALAETPAETPSDATAADATKTAIEEAQSAADAAQAEAAALNEALEAYSKAKAENRKLRILTTLKEELDSYVAAGTLTQEQADLILKYCAEQLTFQHSGSNTGFGGKGGHGGKGFGRGMNNRTDSGTDANGQSSSPGGKHGQFGIFGPTQPQASESQLQAPETQPEQNPSNT